MSNTLTFTYTDWVKKFSPVRNPYRKLNKTFLFQPNGDDLKFVQKHPEERVWTLVKNEAGDEQILNGIVPSRCIAYLITHKPHPKNKNVQVQHQKECLKH